MPWPRGHIKKEKPITIRLTSEQVRQLEAIGASSELRVRQVLEKIVKEYLDGHPGKTTKNLSGKNKH
jgi:hypothetical protein